VTWVAEPCSEKSNHFIPRFARFGSKRGTSGRIEIKDYDEFSIDNQPKAGSKRLIGRTIYQTGKNTIQKTHNAEARSQLGDRRIRKDEILTENHTTQKQLTQKSPSSNAIVAKIPRFLFRDVLSWEREPSYRNDNLSQSPLVFAVGPRATPWREVSGQKKCGFPSIASESSHSLKQKIQ